MQGIKIIKEECTKCGECQRVCPLSCVKMEELPIILESCTLCGLCKEACPADAIVIEQTPSFKTDEGEGVMIYIEHEDGCLKKASLELLNIGRELAAQTLCPLYCLVLGKGAEETSEELLHYGVDKVFFADTASLHDYTNNLYAEAISSIVKKVRPQILLFSATLLARELAPQVAARLCTGLTADCTDLRIEDGKLVQIRPAFGGNIMATIICPRTLPQMATVREGIVKVAEKVGKKGVAKRIPVSLKEKKLMELLSRVSVKEEEVRLQEAAVILSGGRGMQNKENFSLLFELASHLGAAVGASRAVVDQDWVGVQHQVGQTGVIVKPKLYVAFGISGAIQHIVGIKDAECIVAVNKDPDAPIMSVADYRFVADAVQVVKNLLQLCKEET